LVSSSRHACTDAALDAAATHAWRQACGLPPYVRTTGIVETSGVHQAAIFSCDSFSSKFANYREPGALD
jgi:hypothetical protein